MTFGAKLKKLMKERDESYEDVVAIGVFQKSHLYRLLSGKKSPTLEQMQAVAKHFDVPVGYLADDNMDRPDQAGSGLPPDERRYVEMGRALGIERAALIIGLVRTLVDETSLQEVYRRLLKIDPEESSGNPGPNSGLANLKVHARGQGATKPVADDQPKASRK